MKKERDSLVQRMQHDSPSDTQRTRGLQRENAQVYSIVLIMIIINYYTVAMVGCYDQ